MVENSSFQLNNVLLLQVRIYLLKQLIKADLFTHLGKKT